MAEDAVCREPVSAATIRVNREIYREFCVYDRTYRVYLAVNTVVNGFWPEIVTGKEQGNNKWDNRENAWNSRNLFCSIFRWPSS